MATSAGPTEAPLTSLPRLSASDHTATPWTIAFRTPVQAPSWTEVGTHRKARAEAQQRLKQAWKTELEILDKQLDGLVRHSNIRKSTRLKRLHTDADEKRKNLVTPFGLHIKSKPLIKKPVKLGYFPKLFELSPELRNAIYEIVLEDQIPQHHLHHLPRPPGLLQASVQLQAESIGIFGRIILERLSRYVSVRDDTAAPVDVPTPSTAQTTIEAANYDPGDRDMARAAREKPSQRGLCVTDTDVNRGFWETNSVKSCFHSGTRKVTRSILVAQVEMTWRLLGFSHRASAQDGGAMLQKWRQTTAVWKIVHPDEPYPSNGNRISGYPHCKTTRALHSKLLRASIHADGSRGVEDYLMAKRRGWRWVYDCGAQQLVAVEQFDKDPRIEIDLGLYPTKEEMAMYLA